MTKKELERDLKILKSQNFIQSFRIEWDKRHSEYYKAYFRDYYWNDHQRLVDFTDKSDVLRKNIREFIEKRQLEKAREQFEDTYSIILEDHEDGGLFIAEVRTNWDIERIKKETKKLYKEYYSDKRVWGRDFYEELSLNTWLNIYRADVLSI